jgi:hypothetical protein
LAEISEGITITNKSNPKKQVYEACQLADAPKQVLRRKIGYAYRKIGWVYFDLVQNQPAYNGYV